MCLANEISTIFIMDVTKHFLENHIWLRMFVGKYVRHSVPIYWTLVVIEYDYERKKLQSKQKPEENRESMLLKEIRE